MPTKSNSDLYSMCIYYAACRAQGGAVVVAEVLGVAAHPSADRLRVCSLDVGAAEPVSVVTNAADAAAGRRVFVAVSGTGQVDLDEDPEHSSMFWLCPPWLD